jgi:hypothetical protein
MDFQVIEQVVNAARRKLLVQDYIPVYYPNLYITMEHSGRALETTKKYLEHLAVLEEFLAFSSIDLISHLEQRPHSQYLTDTELSRFVSDAGFSKETLAMKYLLPLALGCRYIRDTLSPRSTTAVGGSVG